MAWYREFGNTEYLLVIFFALFYAIYMIRVIRVAHQLKSSFGKILIKLTVRTIAFVLMILAVLGPTFGNTKQEIKSIGKDIMICVDLSNSMNAFDIQPSRLERIKHEMNNVVKAFSADRVGLIAFSYDAYVLCPLTYDQNLLVKQIQSINTSMMPSGTDFGPPLKTAVDKLLNSKEANRTKPKSKVIILISDGEDFGENTEAAIEQIEDENIKLFTLGVGTTSGGKIQTGKGYKRDRDGNVVITKLNPVSLKSLARQTGGEYFEINESENGIPRLINSIAKIEGELREARTIDVSADRYYYFLAIGLLLLFIDFILPIRLLRI